MSPPSSSLNAPPYIIAPSSYHTTTLILLHGTSTSGPEFASTLLSVPIPLPNISSSSISDTSLTKTLPELLPCTKFIFPTGSSRPTTVFGGRESNAWFDIAAFHDRTVSEHLQISGILESKTYLKGLITEEVEKLGGNGRRVIVVGFSQGAAMVGCLMCSDVSGKVGGWVGLSGWMPFVSQLETAVSSCEVLPEGSVAFIHETRRKAAKSVLSELLGMEAAEPGEEREEMETLVWMGHGRQDQKVKVEWGVRMCDLMRSLGFRVEMKTYDGLEHWYSGGEMLDLMKFIRNRWLDL